MAHRSEGSRDRRRFVIGDGAASVQFSSMSGDVVVHARRAASRRRPRPAASAAASTPPTPAPSAARRDSAADEQLRVLRALERGEIDVDEAQPPAGRGARRDA